MSNETNSSSNCTVLEGVISATTALTPEGKDLPYEVSVPISAACVLVGIALLVFGRRTLPFVVCGSVAMASFVGCAYLVLDRVDSCELSIVLCGLASACSTLLVACIVRKWFPLLGGAAFVTLGYVLWQTTSVDALLPDTFPYLMGVSVAQIVALTALFVLGCLCVYFQEKPTKTLSAALLAGALVGFSVHVQSVFVPAWGWLVSCAGSGVLGPFLTYVLFPKLGRSRTGHAPSQVTSRTNN